MAEISVDFLLGPDLSSRFIAWYGQGYGGFSHCASVLADGRYLDARSDILDEVPAGVHIRHPETEACIRRVRCTIVISQDRYNAWEANLRAKIGTPYAEIDIWGFITGRKVTVNGMWDCSQLAINGLQHIDVFPYPLSVEAHQISPNTLLMMLEGVRGKTLTMDPIYVAD